MTQVGRKILLVLCLTASGPASSGGAAVDPITINLAGVSTGLTISRFVLMADEAGRVTGGFDSVLNQYSAIRAAILSLNDAALDGSISILGRKILFGAIESLSTDASSQGESAIASARIINGNSLATTVLGALINVDMAQQANDTYSANLAAQLVSHDALQSSVSSLGMADTEARVSGLGTVALVSAAVNSGELMGNIALNASPPPKWFLTEHIEPSLHLANFDAATTVIGAMNSITAAANDVRRHVDLRTTIQVIGNPAP